MADCSDETLSLLQFFDADSYDKSGMTAELDAFLVRATWLFDERGAESTGYTKFMLQSLETARTIIVDGKVRVLGGPGQVDPLLLSACFQVMSNWLELARRTVRADMPEFETLQMFRAFRLTGEATSDMVSDLTTLGNLFHLPPTMLTPQFHDYRPMAKKWADSGMTTEDAWRRAVADVRDRGSKSIGLHPCCALAQLLARFVAWGGSTCGIERAFSKSCMVAHNARGDISEERRGAELILLQPCDYDSDVIAIAQHSWAAHHGPPRSSRRTRLDACLPHTTQVNPHSETQFIKKRRLDVAAAAGRSGLNHADATMPHDRVVGIDGWEDTTRTHPPKHTPAAHTHTHPPPLTHPRLSGVAPAGGQICRR